jgi:hypothetical protein
MPLQRFEIGDDVIFQPLQDEVVLLNMKDQKYFGLDDVGTEMWKLLIESGDLDIVASRICAEYEVEKLTARHDVEVLVANLVESGLLKVASVSPSGKI